VSVLGGRAGKWLRQRSTTRRAAAWVLAVAGPGLVTLAALPFRSSVGLGGFLFCVLLVVIADAVIGGVWPAITGVVAGAIVFAAPLGSLRVDLHPGLVSLVAFVIVGPAAAILIGKLAQLAGEQASSGRVEAALRRVATLVAHGAPADELFAAVTGEAGQLLQADQTTMTRYEPDGTATVVASWRRTGEAVPPVGDRQRLGGNNLTTIISQTRRAARMDSYADASGAPAAAARQAGFWSAAGAPITVQGRLWGRHDRRLGR
jgi:K+-sensing histidine kinase KdpD